MAISFLDKLKLFGGRILDDVLTAIPTGGHTGQILTKTGEDDYAANWVDSQVSTQDVANKVDITQSDGTHVVTVINDGTRFRTQVATNDQSSFIEANDMEIRFGSNTKQLSLPKDANRLQFNPTANIADPTIREVAFMDDFEHLDELIPPGASRSNKLVDYATLEDYIAANGGGGGSGGGTTGSNKVVLSFDYLTKRFFVISPDTLMTYTLYTLLSNKVIKRRDSYQSNVMPSYNYWVVPLEPMPSWNESLDGPRPIEHSYIIEPTTPFQQLIFVLDTRPDLEPGDLYDFNNISCRWVGGIPTSVITFTDAQLAAINSGIVAADLNRFVEKALLYYVTEPYIHWVYGYQKDLYPEPHLDEIHLRSTPDPYGGVIAEYDQYGKLHTRGEYSGLDMTSIFSELNDGQRCVNVQMLNRCWHLLILPEIERRLLKLIASDFPISNDYSVIGRDTETLLYAAEKTSGSTVVTQTTVKYAYTTEMDDIADGTAVPTTTAIRNKITASLQPLYAAITTLENALANKVSKLGDSMSGALTFNGATTASRAIGFTPNDIIGGRIYLTQNNGKEMYIKFNVTTPSLMNSQGFQTPELYEGDIDPDPEPLPQGVAIEFNVDSLTTPLLMRVFPATANHSELIGIQNLADPTSAQDAATKAYVDRKIAEALASIGH